MLLKAAWIITHRIDGKTQRRDVRTIGRDLLVDVGDLFEGA